MSVAGLFDRHIETHGTDFAIDQEERDAGPNPMSETQGVMPLRAWILMLSLVSLGFHAARAASADPTPLDPVAVTVNTGEKPQSKVWFHADAWWSVLCKASGSWLLKLQGTQWTEVLSLSTSTNAKADVKVDGDVVHILLFEGTASQLVSAEYVTAAGTYVPWTLRPTASSLTLDSGVEVATIDIDSQGRMWLASDGLTTINVRHSDSPYSSWSNGYKIETGVSTDDICLVTAMPDGTVGVLWSNGSTKRFGFKTHEDGANPKRWSEDEVPASQSAMDGVGGGMADDHLNVAVASDGTLYATVKTSYDTPGFPVIALLVRRPGGTWDDLYEVSQSGTRGIVFLSETSHTVTVVYKDGTSAASDEAVVARQSPTSNISFAATDTLKIGGFNNPSSTKQNLTDDVVVLFSSNSVAHGVFWTPGGTATAIADLTPHLGSTLSQNYPNPFNPSTTISFEILESAHVSLQVFDAVGRLVSTLVDSDLSAGVRQVAWDGTDAGGVAVSSGVYFYRLQAGRDAHARKMLLLK
ncbi:MAG: T9SS type A sorting domain-containing protein [Candidatus Krumholzibacteria bacterium]|nr:T9SS type A sorting domain-containing protein [Candidatus Krumholzibacteria bacterium]